MGWDRIRCGSRTTYCLQKENDQWKMGIGREASNCALSSECCDELGLSWLKSCNESKPEKNWQVGWTQFLFVSPLQWTQIWNIKNWEQHLDLCLYHGRVIGIWIFGGHWLPSAARVGEHAMLPELEYFASCKSWIWWGKIFSFLKRIAVTFCCGHWV